MNSKDYFEILGIPPTKDKNKIKKAYRTLAFKYHPDRNRSTNANIKFLQINEAYEQIIHAIDALENSPPKATPLSKRSHRKQKKEVHFRKATAEEKMRYARKMYEYMQKKEEEENERYYHKITSGKSWNIFRIILLVSVFMSIILLLDGYALPLRYQKGFILKAPPSKSIVLLDYSPILLNTKEKVYLSKDFRHLAKDNFFYIARTRILRDIKYIKVWKDNKWHNFPPQFNILTFYPWIQILLLIPLIALFCKGRTPFFSLLYNISIFLMPLLILLVLFTHNRWLHLFTLGYF